MTNLFTVSGDGSQGLVGRTVTKEVTITGEMIDQFASLTGDLALHHTSDEQAKLAGLTGRIAHGLLLISLSGELSSAIGSSIVEQVVSLGYDRIRHLKPVYIGDRIIISYEVSSVEPQNKNVLGRITAVREPGNELVMVATHKMRAIGT